MRGGVVAQSCFKACLLAAEAKRGGVKSEYRDPKPERNPNSEFRITCLARRSTHWPVQPSSVFGLRPSAFFRVSGFVPSDFRRNLVWCLRITHTFAGQSGRGQPHSKTLA